jgi:hypothetical protein
MCSGHGEQYAHTLAKFLHQPKLSMQENALRAAFVVAFVSDDVDITVGGDPQVAMIRNGSQHITYAPNELTRRAAELAKNAKNSLPDLLKLSNEPSTRTQPAATSDRRRRKEA